MSQILGGIADAVELLEPHLGVFLLVVGGLQEQGSDLLIAFLLGLGGKVGVLVAGLRLAGESGLQILLGLGTCVGIGFGFLHLHKLVSGLLAQGALLGSRLALVNITADGALPFCHFLFFLSIQNFTLIFIRGM